MLCPGPGLLPLEIWAPVEYEGLGQLLEYNFFVGHQTMVTKYLIELFIFLFFYFNYTAD